MRNASDHCFGAGWSSKKNPRIRVNYYGECSPHKRQGPVKQVHLSFNFGEACDTCALFLLPGNGHTRAMTRRWRRRLLSVFLVSRPQLAFDKAWLVCCLPGLGWACSRGLLRCLAVPPACWPGLAWDISNEELRWWGTFLLKPGVW